MRDKVCIVDETASNFTFCIPFENLRLTMQMRNDFVLYVILFLNKQQQQNFDEQFFFYVKIFKIRQIKDEEENEKTKICSINKKYTLKMELLINNGRNKSMT